MPAYYFSVVVKHIAAFLENRICSFKLCTLNSFVKYGCIQWLYNLNTHGQCSLTGRPLKEIVIQGFHWLPNLKGHFVVTELTLLVFSRNIPHLKMTIQLKFWGFRLGYFENPKASKPLLLRSNGTPVIVEWADPCSTSE